MALSINVEGQALSQRDEKFGMWKAERFPHVQPSDTEEKEMMDEELYRYAADDKFDELFGKLQRASSRELSSIIFNQVGPSENSLLHVAASHGSKYATELFIHHFPLLITRENSQKDTALHLAARAGQLETTTILVNKAKSHFREESDIVSLMRLLNHRNNTALHDAVISGHHEVARFLVLEDPEITYLKNKEHKSPLYLAVESSSAKKSDEKMLDLLLHAISFDVDSHNNLQGKSPMHAAIEGRKKDILAQITNKKPDLLHRKDAKVGNVLHCAASMGYVSETRFLLAEYRDGVIEKNKEGDLPIHVASKNGHVEVVDEYISHWPDPTEFRNKKGQNILHVAAENGKHRLVKHILQHPKLEALINEVDQDGNTPLHLASKLGRSISTFILVRDRRIKKLVTNSKNLTSYELAEKQSKIVEAEYSGENIQTGKDSKADQTTDNNIGGKMDNKLDYYGVMMTLSILHFFALPYKKPPMVEIFHFQGKPLPKEDIKSRIEALLVVAVLVASVTFSGALQTPKNDSPVTKNGLSANNQDILKNVYIYFDMVALNASVMASIILCWAQLYDVKVAAHAVWLASILTGGAIYLMCLSFVFAVAIDSSSNLLFFSATILVGGALFLVQTLLSAPLIIPPSANQIIERILSPYIYFIIFSIYLNLERMLSKFSKGSKKADEQSKTIPLPKE